MMMMMMMRLEDDEDAEFRDFSYKLASHGMAGACFVWLENVLLVGGLAGKTQQQQLGRVSRWDGVWIEFGGNRVYMNKLNLQNIKI